MNVSRSLKTGLCGYELSDLLRLSALTFECYCVLWRMVWMITGAWWRGQGPGSNVKYLV